ncbi:MAG: type IV pilus twitching motility protein PilT [Pseudoclavibacter sp.]
MSDQQNAYDDWNSQSDLNSLLSNTPGVSFPGAAPAAPATAPLPTIEQSLPADEPTYGFPGATIADAPYAAPAPEPGHAMTPPPMGVPDAPTAVLPTPSLSALPDARFAAAAARPAPSTGVADVLYRINPGFDSEFVASIEAVLDLGASDLHLVGESHPMIRVDGSLRPVPGTSEWNPDRLARVVGSLISDEQARAFERDLELDLAFAVDDIARFRVNVFRDRTGVGAVMRLIPTKIKSLAELGVPANLADLGHLPRGLVLVCGPTGSGKSTTLASIIDVVNSTRPCHIVTVEDPIEFLHHHKKAIINQREVGDDTHSFAEALKHALRQDPDVILVGELRDLETISTALTAAETGHLVFATLHTQDAAQTIDRIIDVYPPHQQAQVRTQLAATIRAVVVQTLLPRASGTGRVVATEVMLTNSAIANLVRSGKTHQIRTVLQSSETGGMHTLDQDLARLVNEGVVEETVAAEQAQDVTEYEQMIASGGLRTGIEAHR